MTRGRRIADTARTRWLLRVNAARLAPGCGVLGLGLLAYGALARLPAYAVIAAVGCALPPLVRTAARVGGRVRAGARIDDLTGLPNSRHFHARLAEAASGRVRTRELAVLLIDLDRFKNVNDRLGHQVGDTVLRLAGDRLANTMRAGDLLARLGGDQFGVLIGDADARAAAAAAKRLRDVLQTPILIDGVTLHLDASIGVALQLDQEHDTESMLQQANAAMYRAKANGTGVETYSADSDGHLADRLVMMEALRTALYDREQLVLHYQPKLTLATGQVTGVEVLVRWHHPERGVVSPDEFLRLAEAGGLMPALTTVVLDQALRQCAAWRSAGRDLSVAVNLSASDLLDPELPALVSALLSNLSLPSSALDLEITESVVMRDPERSLTTLRRLNALGLRLAVDDYGTGYSSLSYLSTLPIRDLKLDQSFILALAGDGPSAERARAIVESTVTLANALGLDLIAEGVETAEILTEVSRLRCTAAQGYHLSRPLPAAELDAWLDARDQAPVTSN